MHDGDHYAGQISDDAGTPKLVLLKEIKLLGRNAKCPRSQSFRECEIDAT